MKRAEFIKVFVDVVGKGRKRQFPNIKGAEEAVSSIGDAEDAAKFWREHHAYFANVSAAQCTAILERAVARTGGPK